MSRDLSPCAWVKIEFVKPKLPEEALAFFRREGSKGGKIAAQSMTPAERSERAAKGAAAREAKRKPKAKRQR